VSHRKSSNPPVWVDDRRPPHSLHKMMSRPGSMPPEMARYFITRYSSTGDLVLDPFCGKGTVLLEASLLGRRAIGFDIAPDVAIVANAKLNPPSISEVERLLESLSFQDGKARGISWQVRTFFSRKTLAQIVDIRDHLFRQLDNGTGKRKRTAHFLLGTLLGILHGHSRLSLSVSCSHSFAMAPRYVREYARKFGLRRPNRDVKECLLFRCRELLADAPPAGSGAAYLGIAEKYPRLRGGTLENSVDLIVTSPPYLDVQTYAKDSWLRLWLLGYEYREIRARLIETGSPKLYLQKMEPCLREMLRVLKPLGYAVIIAGDAPWTCGTEKRFFATAQELGDLGTRLSYSGFTFRIEARMLDEIPAHARYYSSVHKDGRKSRKDPGRKGVRLERIIVLRKVECRGGTKRLEFF